MTATGGLDERFIGWCHRVGADEPTARELWRRLAECYGEARRHYHDLRHIASSLVWLDAVMEGFLAEPIYRTEAFQLRELLARQNIAREIAELRGGRLGS